MSTMGDNGSSSRWDNPDPRVKWAMDVFDYEGVEPNSIGGYYFPIVFFTGLGLSMQPLANFMNRRPMHAKLPFTLLLGGLGVLAGYKFRDYATERRQKEVAVIKHYIMTHPEKFPEPERKKYGDRVVLLPWEPNR